MKTKSIELPAMYGDHHVVEVRRMLLELPGVEDVYASSAFRVVEVSYDPEKTSEETILATLEESGYTGELPMLVESSEATYLTADPQAFMRHTQVFEQTRKIVSFAQRVNYQGRPLWPCPGIGVIKNVEA